MPARQLQTWDLPSIRAISDRGGSEASPAQGVSAQFCQIHTLVKYGWQIHTLVKYGWLIHTLVKYGPYPGALLVKYGGVVVYTRRFPSL